MSDFASDHKNQIQTNSKTFFKNVNDTNSIQQSALQALALTRISPRQTNNTNFEENLFARLADQMEDAEFPKKTTHGH